MSNMKLSRIMLAAGLLLLPAVTPVLADNNPKYVNVPPPGTASTRPPDAVSQAPADQAPLQPTVLSWIENNGDSTTYYRLLSTAGVTGRLSGKTNYTVLVPNDEAWAKLPAGVVDALLLPENKDLLKQVLDYNTIPGSITADDLAARPQVAMLRGGNVRIASSDGRVRIANTNLVASDETAGNGIVYITDTVLLPPGVVKVLSADGYTLTAYDPDVISSDLYAFGDETGVVMDSTQRNYSTLDSGSYGYAQAYRDTTPFGDSGSYGNYSTYDRGNFNPDDVYVRGAATLYSPSMRSDDAHSSSADTYGNNPNMAGGRYRMTAGATAGYGQNGYAGSYGPSGMSSQPTGALSCGPQAELEAAMRKLWTEHVMGTRDYIIAAVDQDDQAKQSAAAQLMQNQEDIGDAFATYYGTAAGDKVTALLRDHINYFAQAADAKVSNDTQQFSDMHANLLANAHDIAVYLNQANPDWPQARTEEMLKMHLSTTTDELLARLNRDYAGDQRALGEVYDTILDMADYLSAGIVSQYPQLAASGFNTENGVVLGSYQTRPGYDQGDAYYSDAHRNNNMDDDKYYGGNCCCR